MANDPCDPGSATISRRRLLTIGAGVAGGFAGAAIAGCTMPGGGVGGPAGDTTTTTPLLPEGMKTFPLELQHDIERIFVQGDEAYVTYRARIVDGSEFRNTEFFTFRGEKVSSVTVYFGASYRDGHFVAQAPPG